MKSANPDEVVAIGAATQCAILAGELDGVVLLDVTSRTLGVGVAGGRFQPVVPKNSSIPTREHKMFATTADGQRELRIDLYEGEHPEAARNRHLGTFVMQNLPDAPAGEVLLMVDFTVDVDGIIGIAAREMLTGARAEVKLQATCGLTRADVRRLAQGMRPA
jgi:molecular chaperone DnaK